MSSPVDGLTFTDPATQTCPFAAYSQLRGQTGIYRDPVNGWYNVIDYNAVCEIARDPATFSSITGELLVRDAPFQKNINAIFEKDGFLPVNTLSVCDPPRHKLQRSLVDKAFSISRVKKMEANLQEVIDELIDQVIDKGDGIDFVTDIAQPFPLKIIAEALGVPRSDLNSLRRWSDAMMAENVQGNDEARQTEITLTLVELQQYIAARAEEYRRTPAENLLSDLVRADMDDQQLPLAELVSMVAQVLVAGNETTTSTMAAAMLKMIELGLESTLRENPALIPKFFEEVLRTESPVQGLYRRATRDVEIAGTHIPAESILVIRWGAGNRDPQRFPEPDVFQLERKNAASHLAFGNGPHFCVGSQLARAELRIAFTSLLKRMRNFRLVNGQDSVGYVTHFFIYGLSRLDIAFDRVS